MTGLKTVDRVHALQTCIERKWQPGQKLSSKNWKTPRKLMGSVAFNERIAKLVPHQAVKVMVLKPDGTNLREDFLYTFPVDVHPTPTEAEHGTSPVA